MTQIPFNRRSSLPIGRPPKKLLIKFTLKYKGKTTCINKELPERIGDGGAREVLKTITLGLATELVDKVCK